jgi:hypothetical protein
MSAGMSFECLSATPKTVSITMMLICSSFWRRPGSAAIRERTNV